MTKTRAQHLAVGEALMEHVTSEDGDCFIGSPRENTDTIIAAAQAHFTAALASPDDAFNLAEMIAGEILLKIDDLENAETRDDAKIQGLKIALKIARSHQR